MKKTLAALAAMCLVAGLPATALAETVPYTAPTNLVEDVVIEEGMPETDYSSVIEQLFTQEQRPGLGFGGGLISPLSDVPAPDDPPSGGDVPEPKSVALASLALGTLVVTTRRGRSQRKRA
jgi:hypothetical protein